MGVGDKEEERVRVINLILLRGFQGGALGEGYTHECLSKISSVLQNYSK